MMEVKGEFTIIEGQLEVSELKLFSDLVTMLKSFNAKWSVKSPRKTFSGGNI